MVTTHCHDSQSRGFATDAAQYAGFATATAAASAQIADRKGGEEGIGRMQGLAVHQEVSECCGAGETMKRLGICSLEHLNMFVWHVIFSYLFSIEHWMGCNGIPVEEEEFVTEFYLIRCCESLDSSGWLYLQ